MPFIPGFHVLIHNDLTVTIEIPRDQKDQVGNAIMYNKIILVGEHDITYTFIL